jgi:hypothetical protein
MSTTKNLSLDQGTTFTENIRYLDNSKNPISLTGYTVKGQLRKSYYSANATATFTTNITNETTGNITISLGFTTTANIAAGRYVYDVVANTVNNVNVVRIQEGILTVNPGVTK